jgi:hypothetical protein
MYRGSRRIDSSCRCHGGCPWCLRNHQHGTNKRLQDAREQVVEAAIAWGMTDQDDAVGTCAAELGLAAALDELDKAKMVQFSDNIQAGRN